MIDKQFILISNGGMFQSDNIAEIIAMITHGEKFVVVDRSNMNTITNLTDLYKIQDLYDQQSFKHLQPEQQNLLRKAQKEGFVEQYHIFRQTWEVKKDAQFLPNVFYRIKKKEDLYASKDAEENHIPRSYENLTPGQKKKILAQIAEINEYVDNWKTEKKNTDMEVLYAGKTQYEDFTPEQQNLVKEAHKEGLVEYSYYSDEWCNKHDDVFFGESFYRIKKK